MYPSIGSEWQSPHGLNVVVDEILNAHHDAPLPAIIVYTDANKVKSAEFYSTFANRFRKFAEAADKIVEILPPKFHVSFDANYIPAELGIHYLVDADPKCDHDIALGVVMDLINERFADSQAALAGMRTAGALNALNGDWRPPRTLADRDRVACAGINLIGHIQRGQAPMIWGNLISNGALIMPWVAFCSAVRYALRRTSFTTHDNAFDRPYTRFTDHMRYAYDTMVTQHRVHRQELVHFQVIERRIVFQIPGHMIQRDLPSTIVLGDGAQQPYLVEMEPNVRAIIDALYGADHIFSGNAV